MGYRKVLCHDTGEYDIGMTFVRDDEPLYRRLKVDPFYHIWVNTHKASKAGIVTALRLLSDRWGGLVT